MTASRGTNLVFSAVRFVCSTIVILSLAELSHAENTSAVIEAMNRESECVSISALPISDDSISHVSARETLDYFQVLGRYQAAHQEIARFFPQATFISQAALVIRPYFGKAEMAHFLASSTPVHLVTSGATPGIPSKYEKLSISCLDGSKEAQGLRVTTRLDPYYARRTEPEPVLEFRYLSNTNARALGFTHGQVVLSLSSGITTAPKFLYNGDREWTEHRRYQQTSQVDGPLILTNYAHTSKGRMLESDHPDFALELDNYEHSTIRITLFFWREQDLRSKNASEVGLPFVYQLVLLPTVVEKQIR